MSKLFCDWLKDRKQQKRKSCGTICFEVTGHALGIWICGCSLFYKRELWTLKSAGAHSTKSLKNSGCKRWCPKDLRVRAPTAPVLTHSLQWIYLWTNQKHTPAKYLWNDAFSGFFFKSKFLQCSVSYKSGLLTGNALARVQRVHKPADLWDITFCTRWFWGF